MTKFCDDAEGWGPLAQHNSDFTLCAQTWLFVFPVASIITTYCIVNLIIYGKQRKTSFGHVSEQIESNKKKQVLVNSELFVCFAVTFGWLCTFIAVIASNNSKTWLLCAIMFELIAWLVVSMYYYQERQYVFIWQTQNLCPSLNLRWFWVLQGLIAMKFIHSIFLRHFENDAGLFWIEFFALLILFVFAIRAFLMKPQLSPRFDLIATVEERASMMNWLTFSWLSLMFKTGYKRALEMTDLNFLRETDKASACEYFFVIF